MLGAFLIELVKRNPHLLGTVLEVPPVSAGSLGQGRGFDTRIALLTANVHASTAATETVESVCDIIGTSVAPAHGIFGACLRDTRTIGGHGAVNGYKLETAAQMRFGPLEDSFAI